MQLWRRKLNRMKNLLYILLFVPLALFGQEITADLFTAPANTGASMTVGFQSSIFDLFVGGQIGAFYDLDSDGTLECVGELDYPTPTEGIPVGFFAITIYGDNTATPEIEGLASGAIPTFAILSNDIVIYIVSIPQFTGYYTNGIININDAEFSGEVGCTDTLALNFSTYATFEDGSCIAVVGGCTDATAFNYNTSSNTDDGSCEYSGCMDPLAFNYTLAATIDDGSCGYLTNLGTIQCGLDTLLYGATTSSYGFENSVYYSFVIDTTSELILNLDGYSSMHEPYILLFDNNQSYIQTISSSHMFSIYNASIEIDSGSYYMVVTAGGHSFYEGTILDYYNEMQTNNQNTGSFTLSLVTYDGSCDYSGCMDSNALNYNVLATVADGSCDYPVDLGTLECGVSLSTALDTLSGVFGNPIIDNPTYFEAYTFTLDSSSTVELSYDIDLSDCSYSCFSHIYVLLFENESLVNIWTQHDDDVGGYSSGDIPSEIDLSAGSYTLVYGNFGYDMYITEEMNINEVTPQFSTGSNDNEHFSFQMEMMSYDGSCDYPGCMDSTAFNFNPFATDSDNSCEYELSPINYTLKPGWNMFAFTGSSPQDAGLALEGIIEEVLIVRNVFGAAYLPEWGFNGIGDLNPGEGYEIKIINNQHTIQFSNNFEIGVELQLETGWNYVGYTGAYTIPIQMALADYDLENTFSEIKDIKGNFWNSTMGTNSSLKYLIPGEAYYINVIENPPLIDFTNQQINVGAESSDEVSLFDYCWQTMTITFPEGSFPNELIGSKVKASFDFDGDGVLDDVSKEYMISNESSLGLVINGDDSMTPELDGMLLNNSPVFTIEYNDIQLILDLEYDILYMTNSRVFYDGAINFRSDFDYCFDPYASYYDSAQHYFSFLEAYNYYGCVDDNYVEFNETASCSDASCITYITYGCTNVAADNYSEVATVEDNTCIFLGCMDNQADNYSSHANSDDNSCIYSGCMDEMACNFIEQASVNLPVCTYPENYRLCSGLCNNDVDNDGICDEEEVSGCTNPDYINFNPSATDDDGTCSDTWQSAFFNTVNGQVSIDIVEGWNLIGYTGVNPLNIEDGVMSIVDIIVIMKNNDGDVYWPEYGFNGIGNLYPGQGYQLKALNSYENFIYSNDNSLAGCTDETACNYNVEAMYFDGSCEYSELCSDCEGNPTPCLLGQSLNGGLVFFIDDTGEHGLIVAPSDIGYYSWGCDTLYVDASSSDGLVNSMIIQSDCNDQINAAIACLTYEYNGYDDWYLPSADELQILFYFLGPSSLGGNIANLSNNEVYLSSHQVFSEGVLGFVNFEDFNGIDVFPTDELFLVRPIRTF